MIEKHTIQEPQQILAQSDIYKYCIQHTARSKLLRKVPQKNCALLLGKAAFVPNGEEIVKNQSHHQDISCNAFLRVVFS